MALSDFLLNRKFVKKAISQQVEKKVDKRFNKRFSKAVTVLNNKIDSRIKDGIEKAGHGTKLRSLESNRGRFNEDAFRPVEDKDLLRAYEQYVWIYTAVFAIASNAAKVPINLFPIKADGTRGDVLKEGPVWELFNMPNPFQSYYDFMEATLSSAELVGDTFIEKSEDQIVRGIPEQMYVLRPDFVTIRSSATQMIESFEYDVNGQIILFSPEQILHFKYYHPRSELYGVSPGEAATNSVVLDLFALTYQKNFFKQGGQMSMYMKVPESLTDEEFKRLKQEVRTEYGGVDRQHLIGVLDNNAELIEVGASPEKSMLKEQRLMNRDEVLAAYGVPPIMVGLLDSATFNNTLEQKKAFWENTIQPKLKKLQDKFNSNFLWDAGFEAEFDFSGIPALQEDQKKKADTATSLVKGGLFTPNEAREDFYQKKPLEGGDDLVLTSTGSTGQEFSNQFGKKARLKQLRKIGLQQFTRLFGDQVDMFDTVLEKLFNKIKNQVIQNVSQISKSEIEIQKDIVSEATRNLEALGVNLFDDILAFEEETARQFLQQSFKRLTRKNLTPDQLAEATKILDAQVADWSQAAADQILNSIKKDITKSMSIALREGEGVKNITQRIQNIFAGSERAKFSRARQIARTEMLRVGNFSTIQAAKTGGFEKKEWVAAGPPNDREFHTAIDREVVNIDDTFSNGLRFPGDPDGGPEEVINCRCTVNFF